MTAADYVEGVLAGNRTVLAQAITLVESTAPGRQAVAGEVMRQLLPHRREAVRLGITGVPGVGKSTFIEAFGMMLCGRGHRVAVLAVDPTSNISGGSILGDKTRMEELSRHPAAYIRPSPSGGNLGGVSRKTRETILLCEAAGYDVVLVETVGVGQSEVAVRSMTDFFLVLMLTGAGDELQGFKKGIIEMADGLVVTKADGGNAAEAARLRAELEQVVHYLTPATTGWRPRVLTCSAFSGAGIPGVWSMIDDFRRAMTASGEWGRRRQQQDAEGVGEFARELLLRRFAEAFATEDCRRLAGEVFAARATLREAAGQMVAAFLQPPA